MTEFGTRTMVTFTSKADGDDTAIGWEPWDMSLQRSGKLEGSSLPLEMLPNEISLVVS